MIDFSCPRCGTVYHAEESHLGKQIRCTNRNCDEVFTIDRQDGQYRYSPQEPEPVTTRRSRVGTSHEKVIAAEIRRQRHRVVVFSIAATLLAFAVGTGGYLIGVSNQRRKVRPRAVQLSPDEVEVEGSGTPHANQATPSPEAKVELQGDGAQPSSVPFSPTSQPANPFYAQQPPPIEPSNGERTPKRRIVPSREMHQQGLPTGTRVIPDEANRGHGQLEAVNGTDFEACVMVVDIQTHRRVREILVQADSSFLMQHLDPGRYEVVFATGEAWDQQAERFNRDASYFEFGKALEFKQYQAAGELHYERHTITLHEVPDGNVPMRPITEAEFHALSGRV